MGQIQNLLNKFWGTEIISFDLNMLEHKLHLAIKSIDFDKEQINEIDFEGITSFYWNHDYTIRVSKSEKPDTWNYYNLNAIFYGASKDKITVDMLSENNSRIKNISYPNIALEIWNSILLIEAQTLKVDGELYHLKV